MFAKLCNWVVAGTVACVLSACGGGEPDNTGGAGPVVLAAATGGQVPAGSAAIGAVPAYGAFADPASGQHTAQQQAGQGGAEQLADAQGLANMSFQAQFQMFTMHGSAAYAIQDAVRARFAAAARVLESRQTNPEIADDEARDRMALDEVEFEKSFSLEKNRELAERKAREGIAEPVVQQAYVPFEDCLDARLPECSGNPRLAHN